MIFDEENKPYVVAEIGAMHGGDYYRLLEYIEACRKSGVDAVKFQIRVADAEVAEDEQWRPGTEPSSGEARAEYWRRIEIPAGCWCTATKIAHAVGLVVIASVFSPEGVKVAIDAGVDCLKIGSGHVEDKEIIESVIDACLPIIASNGMSEYKDDNALAVAYYILQCQSIYPTPNSICKRYDVTVGQSGYSCHTGTIEPVVDAMSRGASIVEVHVKLKGDDNYPDSSSSVTMKQLKRICRHRDFIREASNWTDEKIAECQRITEENRKAIHTGKRFK